MMYCNSRGRTRRTMRGFTLLEMMLVVLIIGLLAAAVAWNFAGQGDKAKIQIAGKDISLMASAVESYYLEKGQYPATLAALVDAKVIGKVNKDPWKRDYVYYAPGPDGRPYALFSAGPDGQAGSPDDINFWTLGQGGGN